jgi:hypothetical protein
MLGGQAVGNVVAADNLAITVAAEDVGDRRSDAIAGSTRRVVTRIALAQIERIDVSLGKRSLAGQGALIGAAVPAAISLVGLGLGSAIRPRHGDIDNTGYHVAVWAAVAVAPAAIVGAALGAGVRTDRWEPACAKPLRVTVAPDLRGGARVGLAVRF